MERNICAWSCPPKCCHAQILHAVEVILEIWGHCEFCSLFFVLLTSPTTTPATWISADLCQIKLLISDKQYELGSFELISIPAFIVFPSSLKNSKGWTPGFNIQDLNFWGGIWARSKRLYKNYENIVNYQCYWWEWMAMYSSILLG